MDETEINRIAALAKLELSQESAELFRSEFERIMDYMSVLEEAELSPDIASEPIGVEALRPDVPAVYPEREELLRNAPRQAAGMILVPKTVE